MNKQETIIVVALFMCLLGWGYIQKLNYVPPPPKANAPMHSGGTNGLAAESTVALRNPTEILARPESGKQAEIGITQAEQTGHSKGEEIVVLSNDLMNVHVSSWGAGIASVELKKYKATQAQDSAPVSLDFSSDSALSFSGLPGVSTNEDYDVAVLKDGKTVRVGRLTKDGLSFERTISVSNSYRLQIVDVFSNSTTSPLTLPARGMAVGPMRETAAASTGSTRGTISYLGLDTLPATGGDPTKNWGGDLPGFFGVRSGFLGCSRQNVEFMPPTVSKLIVTPVAWVAAKSKFFVQILEPSVNGKEFELQAQRDMTHSNGLMIASVSATLILPQKVIQPGESFETETSYYVGPKEYSALKQLANHQLDVMEFGKWFGWLCPPLLLTMTAIYSVIPNYGLAVILLTCIVRLILFPITRKAMKSMKEMQKIQPLVNQIKEKYKDKPQKMNQEVMALYKEHKVNPMAGCLPIVLQIPIFIALFTVLRSAVELRYAHFLWIKDLSAPEGLWAGAAIFNVFPMSMIGSINILPLFMTATTIWQQRLQPAAGDPQQQKMMMYMPIIFLAMFYNMASALVLYWTVSQLLSIAGLLWQKRNTVPDTGKTK
jgi:YidC/Oxa1 family membrane protein insertase